MQLNFQTSLCQNVIAVTKDFRTRSRVDNNKALKTVRETLILHNWTLYKRSQNKSIIRANIRPGHSFSSQTY